MPQMAPIYWLIMMIYFIFMLMMLIMLIYFFYTSPSTKMLSMKLNNWLNWVW